MLHMVPPHVVQELKSAAQSVQTRKHHIKKMFGGYEQPPFDWQSKGPLEFIEFLKAQYRAGFPFFTIATYHRGWLHSADLDALEKLRTSKEPCSGLVSPIQSNLRATTVGDIAEELIASIHGGGFPSMYRPVEPTK
jgi:hypothetical protein